MKTTQSILLVEDDATDIFFLRTALTAAGLSDLLHLAEDVQRARHYLAGVGEYGNREQYPLPDLVLLDVKLPGVTGLEILRWMRQQPALDTVAIIVLTTSCEASDIRTAFRLRANSYLVKPGDADEMRIMVETMAHYWLRLNQPTASARSARLELATPSLQGSRLA